MRITRTVIGLCAALMLFAACSGSAEPGIRGTVYLSKGKGVAVADAEVTLSNNAYKPEDAAYKVGTVKTDAQGHFEFKGVAVAAYSLSLIWRVPSSLPSGQIIRCNFGPLSFRDEWLIVSAKRDDGSAVIIGTLDLHEVKPSDAVERNLDLGCD